MNTEACRRLVAAMIHQAVDDYKAMVNAGWIVKGKTVVPTTDQMEADGGAAAWLKRRKVGIQARQYECHGLLYFFKPGGPMEEWLHMARLEIDPDAIRTKLGL